MNWSMHKKGTYKERDERTLEIPLPFLLIVQVFPLVALLSLQVPHEADLIVKEKSIRETSVLR